MDYRVELIKQALNKAKKRESKLTQDVLNIEHPGGGGKQIRHLLNNLGYFSKNYLEIGLYKGGSYCAAIFKNESLYSATAIDVFNDDVTYNAKCKETFIENRDNYSPIELKHDLIHKDCFRVDLKHEVTTTIDFYYYDANHDEESHCKALTYYLSVLGTIFIFCVDDYSWPDVKDGTQRGIRECNLDVLFEQELITNHPQDNNSWWNGFYVALLKKKQ